MSKEAEGLDSDGGQEARGLLMKSGPQNRGRGFRGREGGMCGETHEHETIYKRAHAQTRRASLIHRERGRVEAPFHL